MDDKDAQIHELTLQVNALRVSLERYKAAIRMLTKILDTSNNLIKRLEEIENGTMTGNQTTHKRPGRVV